MIRSVNILQIEEDHDDEIDVCRPLVPPTPFLFPFLFIRQKYLMFTGCLLKELCEKIIARRDFRRGGMEWEPFLKELVYRMCRSDRNRLGFLEVLWNGKRKMKKAIWVGDVFEIEMKQ